MGLRRGVAVSLESSVDDVGALVVEVGHDWLRHGSVPRDVSGLSVSVSIYSPVVLMEDWLLSCLPLSVDIWDWSWLWGSSSQVPESQVWIVQE